MRVEKLTGKDWTREIRMTFTALEWMVIHGQISLALRHPENKGPSRSYAELVLRQIERRFRELNVLDDQDLARIHADQVQTRGENHECATDNSGVR